MAQHTGRGPGDASMERRRANGIIDSVLSDLPGVVYRCGNDRDRTMLGLTANVEELTGYPPADLIGTDGTPFAEVIHPNDRERVWNAAQAAVEEDEPFRVTYRIRTRDGAERWILEQGRAVREDGETVLTGYLQDVTGPYVERLAAAEEKLALFRRQSAHLALLQSVTAIVNRERRLEAALRAVLPVVCDALDFQVGHVFVDQIEEEPAPRSAPIWHLAEGVDGLEHFRRATDDGGWSVSEGLPGRVMRSGAAEWVEDVKGAPDFFRVDETDPSPVRSGVALPVRSEERTLAVLEFYMTERHRRDPEIMEILEQIGVQLGRVWERERAERERRSGERRFRQLAENIDAGFWLSTPEGEPLYVSSGFEAITGVTSLVDDWREYLEVIHPDDRERLAALFSREDRAPYEIEYRVVRDDGEVRWLRQKAFPIHDDEGNVYRIGGLTDDVTESRRARERLERTTRMLRQTLSSLEEAVLVVGGAGAPRTIQEVNAASERVFGYTREELVGSTTEKLHADRESFERFGTVSEEVLRKEGVFRGEFPLRRKDGTVFQAEQTVTLLDPERGLEGGVVSVVRDVSERKEAESRLEQSEERFRQIAERIDSVFWVSSPEKDEMEYVSPAFGEVWGMAPEVLHEEPTAWLERIHPEDRERVRAALPSQLEGDYEEEYRVVRPDGEVRWIWDRAFPVKDEEGEVWRLIGIAEDITERRRAEEEVRRAEEHYRALIESSPDVIAILDEDLVTRYVSSSVEEVLGYTPEEITDTEGESRVHPEDRDEALRHLRELRSRPCETLLQTHRMIAADGSVVHVESRAQNLLDDPAVEGIVVNLRDMTDRRELEAQLRQAQKMEAVGRLAGGIAHDFNNLLTVIRSQSDLLLMDLPPEDRMTEEVEVIRSASDRAADLTSQLLAFSREQVLRPKLVDLDDVLGGMTELLVRILGEDIRIEVDLAEELPPIRVDPGQLEQVILNLGVNARDAMRDGGTLTLTTGTEKLSAEESDTEPELEPGTVVFLRVSDTGSGMDEETKARIFEPFFTTKESQEGIGLGLAVSYGIVRQSGGTIEVESDPGRGTTFTIRFPAAEGTPVEGVDAPPPELRGEEVGGGILIVEDDPNVRNVVRRILERGGFDVRTAEDAEVGLELLERDGGGVDLVLTDLVLPGMGGRRLVERVMERFPDVDLVVMSGYAEGSQGNRQDLPEEVAFIQKPFTPERLVDVIREKLAAE